MLLVNIILWSKLNFHTSLNGIIKKLDSPDYYYYDDMDDVVRLGGIYCGKDS